MADIENIMKRQDALCNEYLELAEFVKGNIDKINPGDRKDVRKVVQETAANVEDFAKRFKNVHENEKELRKDILDIDVDEITRPEKELVLAKWKEIEKAAMICKGALLTKGVVF